MSFCSPGDRGISTDPLHRGEAERGWVSRAGRAKRAADHDGRGRALLAQIRTADHFWASVAIRKRRERKPTVARRREPNSARRFNSQILTNVSEYLTPWKRRLRPQLEQNQTMPSRSRVLLLLGPAARCGLLRFGSLRDQPIDRPAQHSDPGRAAS